MFEWDNLKIKSSKQIIKKQQKFPVWMKWNIVISSIEFNSIPKIDRLEHMTTTSMTTSSWEHMISCAI